MPRVRQIVFVISFAAINWYGMQATHELGHVLGAYASGGRVSNVVLHPLSISRTDVAPNPHPLVVVWLGPLVGCLLPVAVRAMLRRNPLRAMAQFFAGFCLIANGLYISLGSVDRVGDCGVMLEHGTPLWLLWAFGALTVPLGLFLWHHLGSLRAFAQDTSMVTSAQAWSTLAVLAIWLVAGGALSSR